MAVGEMRLPARRAGLLAAVWPQDRGLASLRRATRATLVVPAAVYLVSAAGQSQTALFASFVCFGLLVMADFGGSLYARAYAYLLATLFGAALVGLATLVPTIAWIAVPAAFLVAFCIQFAGHFGGYPSAARSVLMLAFLLGLLLPAPGASVASRVFVWIAAGLLATMAALVVWPHFERPALLRGAAMACEALAELAEVVLEPVPADSELQRRAATVAVEGAYRSYAITPLRPAGPRRRDRALVELLTQLEAARAILASWSGRGLAPDLPVGERLSAAVVRRLEAAAAALGGGSGEIRLDLVDLEETAGAHRQAVCSWARDALRAGKPPEQVLDGLESAHTLRLLTHLTLEITENAVVAAGGRSLRAEKLTWRRRLWAVLGAPLAAVRALRRRLDPSAGAVRDGLRVALGLAALVLAARLLPSGHSPWMVVAAVAVLRANALATERTMVQALAGTLIGIAAAAVGVLAVGQNTYPLWLVLPVTTFLAAYTPGVATYALGQAATVVNTVVLLELTRPPGWQPGMVRIPELAACAVAAVVAGLLIWPRGSRVHLNRRLAALYRSASHFLATCLDRLQSLTPPPDPAASRSLAAAARQRAAEAFEELLDERLPALPSAEASARLLASGSQVILAGDLISLEAESGYRALPPREAEVELRVQAQALLDGLASLGGRLERAQDWPPAEAVSVPALREAALASLRRWKQRRIDSKSAAGAVAAAHWIAFLGALAAALEQSAITASSPSSWYAA